MDVWWGLPCRSLTKIEPPRNPRASIHVNPISIGSKKPGIWSLSTASQNESFLKTIHRPRFPDFPELGDCCPVRYHKQVLHIWYGPLQSLVVGGSSIEVRRGLWMFLQQQLAGLGSGLEPGASSTDLGRASAQPVTVMGSCSARLRCSPERVCRVLPQLAGSITWDLFNSSLVDGFNVVVGFSSTSGE